MSNMHYAYHQLVQINVRMNILDWVQCAQEERSDHEPKYCVMLMLA